MEALITSDSKQTLRCQNSVKLRRWKSEFFISSGHSQELSQSLVGTAMKKRKKIRVYLKMPETAAWKMMSEGEM